MLPAFVIPLSTSNRSLTHTVNAFEKPNHVVQPTAGDSISHHAPPRSHHVAGGGHLRCRAMESPLRVGRACQAMWPGTAPALLRQNPPCTHRRDAAPATLPPQHSGPPATTWRSRKPASCPPPAPPPRGLQIPACSAAPQTLLHLSPLPHTSPGVPGGR